MMLEKNEIIICTHIMRTLTWFVVMCCLVHQCSQPVAMIYNSIIILLRVYTDYKKTIE
jgi:hypothetical protein